MLEHRLPSCRSRFSARDFEFVASVLAPAGPTCHLAKLWNDAEGMREILDLREIFQRLIESPAAVQVTPRFYFYVMVRHAFLRGGLGDVELADYVAGVLSKRVGTDHSDPLQDVTGGFTRAAEFLAFIDSSHGRMRYHLQVAAGNQFLVLTGLYPGYIRRRNERGEAPDLGFYERFAQRSFRIAARLSPEGRGRSRRIFGALAEALPTARHSLNRMAEELVFLGG